MLLGKETEGKEVDGVEWVEYFVGVCREFEDRIVRTLSCLQFVLERWLIWRVVVWYAV